MKNLNENIGGQIENEFQDWLDMMYTDKDYPEIETLETVIEYAQDTLRDYRADYTVFESKNRKMENLNEGKNKKGKMTYEAALREIDAQSAIVAMEAKIEKLKEMAEAKETRLNMVSEDENLSELIDKRAMNEMKKEIKQIKKMQEKLERLYEKKNGKKMPEMVDEDEEIKEMFPDKNKDGTYDISKVLDKAVHGDDVKRDPATGNPIKEDELDEAHCNTEEDDTKESTNEEFLRMQKLAGIISEEEYKKRLNENKTHNKIKNTILESIFDKVAAAVKGKSDKEKATIDAFKKFGIQVGKPFYQFAYLPGASIEDKALQYFDSLTPEQKEKVNVPIPNGYDGKLEKDGLKKVVFQSIEEGEDGTVNITMIVGDYNFKTGKFVDEDGPSTFSIDSSDQIEKDLGGEKDANEKIYTQGLKMVPYNGSLWQEFVDRKAAGTDKRN